MKRNLDLVNGKIMQVLMLLALPMVAANLAQTAYGLIDMVWIGSLGSQSVSAVGTASFYINLATALSTLVTIGAGTKFAQSIGSKNEQSTKEIFNASIYLSLLISFLYLALIFIFKESLINFYGISDEVVVNLSLNYLVTSLYGIQFLFISLTLTSLLTSRGLTKSVLVANLVGLSINIILDPLLIFGYAFFPQLGVVGAAWATNISRLFSTLILIYALKDDILNYFDIKPKLNQIKVILTMGIPVALQRVIFIFISMYMAKIVAQFGTEAIAAQKIGLQIESITFVMVGGLQGAVVAFIGQNYGANKHERIKIAYNKALLFALAFSSITMLAFIIFPKTLLRIFISESEVINIGVGYMRAIGLSQMFMSMEYITVGVFNGIGKTYIPPLISVIFTALRIPLALFLIKYLGINGVWWSISISSIVKGLINFTWMKILLRKAEF